MDTVVWFDPPMIATDGQAITLLWQCATDIRIEEDDEDEE